MYTIGQVSEMFNIPISTLRYYDKEGLFPNIKRVSGIRRFSDAELEALNVIECLKKSGLEIKDIKQFMEWCREGSSTYSKRKQLFEERRKALQEQMAQLQKTMDMIEFKCHLYFSGYSTNTRMIISTFSNRFRSLHYVTVLDSCYAYACTHQVLTYCKYENLTYNHPCIFTLVKAKD